MLAKRKEEFEEDLEEKEQYDAYLEPPVEQTPEMERMRRPTLNTRLRARCFFLLLLLIAMATLITVRSGISASRGYDLVAVQQQAEQLEHENEHLKIDIAQLKSPQRIKQIATEELGMIFPQNVYFSANR